ncbi:mate-domain-containing protein, partial [Kickxella alabastrina]|uniref:mate-domain-containing protein n=1 Tax=Kickxella alabastrina TaxID=61397 RepID=UPI00222023F9
YYQFSKALPMGLAGTLRSTTSILELQALGHMGSKPLAGRSLSLLIVNLTGYPFMYGLGGALETLCSQGFTATVPGTKKIGVYVQHAIWLFLLANVFLAILWLNPKTFLSMLNADAEVLHYAKVYLAFECLYFPFIIVQTCLKRFLLAQGLMQPTVGFEMAGLVGMWAGLRLFGDSGWNLGFIGVPLASTIAYFAVLLANALYIYMMPCRTGRACAISGIASYGFSDLATLAVTSLGAHGLAIQAVLNSIKGAFARTGSYLSMVISSRTGNLLGDRNPQGARLSANVSVLMTLLSATLIAFPMLVSPKLIASFITKDPELILGLVPLMPLLALVTVLDVVSNVLTGVLRGQSRQAVAAVVRVVALYVVAVPLAWLLCFAVGWGLAGLWVGMAVGFVLIAGTEAWLVFTSDWVAETERCMQRIGAAKWPLSPLLAEAAPIDESTPLFQ